MNYSVDKAGHGICGHKNSYTAKVHDGNWTEDKIATDLLMTREVPPNSYLTEQSGNYKNPRDVPEDPRMATIKLEYIEDIRARNKEGLPYTLIFDHTIGCPSPSERFRSQYQEASEDRIRHYALPDGALLQKRQEYYDEERFDTVNMITISQKATQRQNTLPPKTTTQKRIEQIKADLKPEALPKWNRRKPKLTSAV